MAREFPCGSSTLATLAAGRVTDTPSPGAPATQHLTQTDLASRWRISERTLERWRWQKVGPAYVKVGGRVVYRLADILSYEAAQRRAPARTADPFFRRPR